MFANKKVVRIPEEERITSNRASVYEISNAISKRIPMINSNYVTYVDVLTVSVDELSDKKRAAVNPKDIIEIDGKHYVSLTSTSDIARCEINNKKSPLSLVRIISEDYVNGIIYVEIVSVNQLDIELLPYLENLGI